MTLIKAKVIKQDLKTNWLEMTSFEETESNEIEMEDHCVSDVL